MLIRLAALLTLLAAPAQADVFDLVTGRWGRLDDPELSCQMNPHQIDFSADRSRATFIWEAPLLAYDGLWRESGGYDVLGHDARSITMALDGESRKAAEGNPVVWILRVRENGSFYCWSRTDWSAEDCIDRYIRCGGDRPVS